MVAEFAPADTESVGEADQLPADSLVLEIAVNCQIGQVTTVSKIG